MIPRWVPTILAPPNGGESFSAVQVSNSARPTLNAKRDYFAPIHQCCARRVAGP
jgi:hypothetical protein